MADSNSTNSHAKITEDEHDFYDHDHEYDHEASNINESEELHSHET